MNFDADAYRAGVVEPYQAIRDLQEQVEKAERLPSVEEMIQALTLLKTIFETKGTPADEQSDRFRQILQETATLNLLRDEVRELQLI